MVRVHSCLPFDSPLRGVARWQAACRSTCRMALSELMSRASRSAARSIRKRLPVISNDRDLRHAARRLQPSCARRHPRPATSRPRSLRASPRRRSRRSSTARLVDLTFPLASDATRPRSSPTESPEALHALSPQHGAPAGRGGHAICFPARSAASARRPTKASSTTSSSSGRSCRRISTAIEKKMKELASQDLPSTSARCGRARRRCDFFAETRRAAQGAADRGEDRRPDRGLRATRSRTATPSSTSASARTCRRPAG